MGSSFAPLGAKTSRYRASAFGLTIEGESTAGRETQRVDHGAFTLLDGDAHRPPAKPLPQLGRPGMQHIGPLLELQPLDRAAGHRLQLHRVVLIAPVQADVRCQVVLLGPHGPSVSGTRAGPWSCASPIVES